MMPTLPNASGMSEMEAVKAIGARFTPGPWRYETDGAPDNDMRHAVLAECNDLWVAACYRSGTRPNDEREADAEAQANARLIASAPRLYDTLTHLIAAARKVSPSDPAAAEIIEMCARAEHEQAKARGETA